MQYPIRKTMLIACLAMAGVAFATTTISTKDQYRSESLTASAQVAVSPAPAPAPSADAISGDLSMELYHDLNLASNGMNPEVFETALKGFTKLSNEGKISRQDKITIVDFSQPSDHKRLYVIDLNNKEILFQSLVSHGMGTGELWANSFSNNPSSYKSSPGFYITPGNLYWQQWLFPSIGWT